MIKLYFNDGNAKNLTLENVTAFEFSKSKKVNIKFIDKIKTADEMLKAEKFTLIPGTNIYSNADNATIVRGMILTQQINNMLFKMKRENKQILSRPL